jgi:hypothetical protein
MLILFAEKDLKVEPVRSSSIAEAALQNAARENSTVRVILGSITSSKVLIELHRSRKRPTLDFRERFSTLLRPGS